MKHPLATTSALAVLAGIAVLSTPAFAVVNIDWVDVGHAGNAADPATGSLYGAVAYAYKIGKYEVTNAQYTAFLNAVDPTGANANGIYNSNMGSNARGGISFNVAAANGAKYSAKTNMGDKPVNYVSWYDAARFTNWLHNGQGSGSTETGAYTLNGNTGLITKNVGATVWLPSEDEWYKAAYYDPTAGAGGGDNYWTYATQSNLAPTVASANATGDVSNPGANVVNYNRGADWNSQDGNVTTVGSAAANNYFGTADMNGNVWEWNDAIIGSSRGLRGGSWKLTSFGLAASSRSSNTPTAEALPRGFPRRQCPRALRSPDDVHCSGSVTHQKAS
jgi:formylglycine-generating enzyme required for sulfatase activity